MSQKKSTEEIEHNIDERIKKLAELRKVKTGENVSKENKTWIEMFSDEEINYINENEIKILTKLGRFLEEIPEKNDKMYIFSLIDFMCSNKYQVTEVNVNEYSIEIKAVVNEKLVNRISFNTFLSNTTLPREIKEALKAQIKVDYKTSGKEE